MPKNKSQKKVSAKKSPAKKADKKASSPKSGLQPLHDRVLIKEDTDSKERVTASGIIIPAGTEEKESKKGKVIATGPGRTEDGKLVPVSVKPGNIVLFQWGDKVKIAGEEYYLVRESEILAVLNS